MRKRALPDERDVHPSCRNAASQRNPRAGRYRFWAAVDELQGLLASRDPFPIGSPFTTHSSIAETKRRESPGFRGSRLDYDDGGNLAGIDIDHASRKLDLREVITNHIPLVAKTSP